jgi:hypothetical protein
MCIGIEYFLEGERKSVYFDAVAPDLPARLRGGAIGFYRWRAAPPFMTAGISQGWRAKFPETGCAPLEEIRAGKWANLEPRPADRPTSSAVAHTALYERRPRVRSGSCALASSTS